VKQELLRCGDVFDRRLVVVVAAEVDVPGRSGGRLEPEVERECAFEYPAARRDGDEAAQEELERHLLPQACQGKPGAGRFGLESVVERLAERRGSCVPHRSSPATSNPLMARVLPR